MRTCLHLEGTLTRRGICAHAYTWKAHSPGKGETMAWRSSWATRTEGLLPTCRHSTQTQDVHLSIQSPRSRSMRVSWLHVQAKPMHAGKGLEP